MTAIDCCSLAPDWKHAAFAAACYEVLEASIRKVLCASLVISRQVVGAVVPSVDGRVSKPPLVLDVVRPVHDKGADNLHLLGKVYGSFLAVISTGVITCNGAETLINEGFWACIPL